MYTHPSSQRRAQPQLRSGVPSLASDLEGLLSFPVTFTWPPSWEPGRAVEGTLTGRAVSGGTTLSALREVSHTPSVLMEIVKEKLITLHLSLHIAQALSLAIMTIP